MSAKIDGIPTEAAKATSYRFNIFLGAFMAVLGIASVMAGLRFQSGDPSAIQMNAFISFLITPFLVSSGITLLITSSIDYAHLKKK